GGMQTASAMLVVAQPVPAPAMRNTMRTICRRTAFSIGWGSGLWMEPSIRATPVSPRWTPKLSSRPFEVLPMLKFRDFAQMRLKFSTTRTIQPDLARNSAEPRRSNDSPSETVLLLASRTARPLTTAGIVGASATRPHEAGIAIEAVASLARHKSLNVAQL